MSLEVTKYIWSEVWSRFWERIRNTYNQAKKGWNMDIDEAKKIVDDKVKQYQKEVDAKLGKTPLDELASIAEKSLKENAEVPAAHLHKWSRGVLPNQVYLKQCACGASEKISLAEWTQL